jgi:anti-anti-sigma regulatory factor
MRYVTENDAGILIVQVLDEVLNQQMTDELRKLLFGGLRDEYRATILDLSGVTYAASLPLSIVIASGQQLQEFGRRLLLVNVPEVMREALSRHYSTQPFEYYNSRAEALQTVADA